MEATLQGIFRESFVEYKERHGLSMDQHKAAQAIMDCHSDAIGHEEWACPNEDHVERQYHSCRHRSCPRCHRAEMNNWLEKTKARLLPCDHYHVVFTLPHELNPIWHYNRHWCSDALFKAASETLRQLLKDDRYLGAEVGMLASLHTWGRTLSFHPHLHLLVSGGGLSGEEWKRVKKDFLLPVGVIKAKFRGKWLSWINAAYDKGDIQLPPDWTERDWKRALCRIARKNWNIRIQGAYRHGKGVAVYLSRYVKGGPIKDHALLRADGRTVDFRYRDYRDDKTKIMTLSVDNFISRVLWHVPIKGQHNVRYYGLYVPGATDKRDSIRSHLGEAPGEVVPEKDPKERRCPVCGHLLAFVGRARAESSYIKSAPVQQAVQVDRDTASLRRKSRSVDLSAAFFWPQQRPLN